MPETQEQQQPRIGAVEGRPDVTVVTQENFNEYVNQELGLPASGAAVEDEGADIDPDAAAEETSKAGEPAKAADATAKAEPKEGDIDGTKVFFRGKWVHKHDFNYRVHLKTEEARKELNEKIETTAKEAREAKEAAEKAARERDELKNKYEPPEPLEAGPEPDPQNYTDMDKFRADLKTWAAKNARAEDAKRIAADRAQREAEERIKRLKDGESELQKEIPDYNERLANAPGVDVAVPPDLLNAILDSDISARLRLHLAENVDVLNKLKAMPVSRMNRELGKIEVSLGKTETKETTPAATLGSIQMSKAPPPITPIRGGNAGATGLKFDSNGNWTGTPEEWKAARAAGKIR